MAKVRGNVQQFAIWLRQQSEVELPKFVQRVHMKVHFQLVDLNVAGTPVGNPSLWESPPPKGYAGGRAKGNWQSGIGSIPRGETGRLDPGGGATISENQAVAMKIEAFTVSYIVNNVPYIQRLNADPPHSKQQTAYWIEGNIQTILAQFE